MKEKRQDTETEQAATAVGEILATAEDITNEYKRNHGAEPGARDKMHACHVSCFAPAAPSKHLSHLKRSAKIMKEEHESPFTGAGKMLFLATAIPTCGGIAYVLLFLFPNLPPGSYPLFYLFGPVLIAAALFFFGVAAFLRKRGIAVLVSEKEEVEQMKKDRDAMKTVKE